MENSALLDFLRDRDVACPLCGYNLRGLTSPRCPECGRDLRLSVGLAEPFLRAWVLLAVATVAPAGIGLVFVAVLIRDRAFMPREWWYVASAVYFLACIPLAVVVLICRRWFVRLPKRVQWTAAAAIALLSATLLIWFLAMVR